MNKDFLGKGWKFPVRADVHGKVSMSEYKDDIEEAIRIILGTAKGERLMRPDFGCGIHEYVFSSINPANLLRIENTVREALKLWEPRIDVLNVKSDSQLADEGKLLINIEYRIRSNNTKFNLVYPFFLKEGI